MTPCQEKKKKEHQQQSTNITHITTETWTSYSNCWQAHKYYKVHKILQIYIIFFFLKECLEALGTQYFCICSRYLMDCQNTPMHMRVRRCACMHTGNPSPCNTHVRTHIQVTHTISHVLIFKWEKKGYNACTICHHLVGDKMCRYCCVFCY